MRGLTATGISATWRTRSTLADRLVRAAGFGNVVAHAYKSLDMQRVHEAAASGPTDLLRFLGRLADRIS